MRKYLIFLIVALAILSISAVSAAENSTDVDYVAVDENVESAFVDDVSPSEEVELQESEISAKSTTGYEKFSTSFTVTLTSNGTALASKPVSVSVNKVNYNKTTDSKGQVTLNVKLAKGTYPVSFSFLGDENYTASNGTAKITVKSPTKTTLKVSDKNINYRQGLKSAFIVRLLTSSGKAVKNQKIKVTSGGKTVYGVTDSKGYALVFLSLKKGTRKVSYSFKAKSPYLSSSGSCKVKVKASMGKGYGYAVLTSGFKKVNFKTLKNKGVKKIFLHSSNINMYGKSTVTSWIAKANKYGIKVFIWMEVFYNGKWITPVKSDGSYKYSYINKQIKLAKSYAKMKGVSGLYLDGMRFAGKAYNYDTATGAINYFAKKVCTEVRKAKPNCIIAASVMPEPGMTDYYYGQDIPTITKYVDAIVPLSFKGNYGKTTSWIKYVADSFALQSNGAQVWAGIQTYKSDKNVKKLSYSQLMKDTKSALSGYAKGAILFRSDASYILNFNKV